MGERSISFEFDLESLAQSAIDAVAAAAAPRTFSDSERLIARGLFWARAHATHGDWVEIAFDGSAKLRIEAGFLKGYVAHALNFFGVRKLGLVS